MRLRLRGSAVSRVRTPLATALASGVVLASAVGVVLVCRSIGGDGSASGSHGAILTDGGSASYCQDHGPGEHSYRGDTLHGRIVVILVVDCHGSHFHFAFKADKGYRYRGFRYRFDDGPIRSYTGSSYDTEAPWGTTQVTVAVGGSTHVFPVS